MCGLHLASLDSFRELCSSQPSSLRSTLRPPAPPARPFEPVARHPARHNVCMAQDVRNPTRGRAHVSHAVTCGSAAAFAARARGGARRSWPEWRARESDNCELYRALGRSQESERQGVNRTTSTSMKPPRNGYEGLFTVTRHIDTWRATSDLARSTRHHTAQHTQETHTTTRVYLIEQQPEVYSHETALASFCPECVAGNPVPSSLKGVRLLLR